MNDKPHDTPRCFFRDLGHNENFENGMSFHASGVVMDRYSTNSGSGKNLCVMFVHPFKAIIETAWRSNCDVELFDVSDYEWGEMVSLLETMDTLND